ncbi:heterokaryon incompatibility protein [Apiospora hydei]|uniref:Heterokaryon incompatibility protein n=1 Tax=Apiospora hydei TaxID=1337664 RepID=A0ABR1VWP3_9PEZI
MRAIYSSCTRALLWMGELEEETQFADAGAGVAVLEYIAAFDPGTDSDSETGSDSDTDSHSDTASEAETSAGSETNNDSEPETSPKEAVAVPVPECAKSEEAFRAAMTALGLIGPRKGPWWHRVWMVQEAMLPPDAVFLWGPFSISWDTMDAATRAWVQTSDYEEHLTPSQCEMLHDPGHLGSLMATVIWMNCYNHETGEPPLPTAIKWRTRSATMPVDTVYALTGLNSGGVLPRSEKCDYSLDMRQVYINYTLDLIHRDGDGGDLQPLVIDPRREKPDDEADDEGLPRWAVDMRSFPKYDTVPWRQHHFYSRFEANKGLPRDHPPQYDGAALRLSGVAIDTVAEVGEGHYVKVDGTNEYPPIRPILRAWWTLYCKSLVANLDVPDDVLYCGLEPGNCDAYDRFCRLVSLLDRQDVARHLRTGEPIEHLRVSVGRAIKNRRFFVTVGGLLGLGHLETEPGDEVWVFSHGRVPFTLRPRRGGGGGSNTDGGGGGGGDDDYDFVGACHVQGIMFGDEGIREAAELGQRIARLY